MPLHFYVLPLERVAGEGTTVYRGPKYFTWRFDPDPPGFSGPCSIQPYGLIDECLLCGYTSDAEHAFLQAQADVYAFPAKLNVNMPQAEMTKLLNVLEGAFVPGGWLNGSLTYLEVARVISGMFLVMGRLSEKAGSPLTWGITLNTQFRNIPADKQQAIRDTFTIYGWDAGLISGNDTMRSLLKYMADQRMLTPVDCGYAVL